MTFQRKYIQVVVLVCITTLMQIAYGQRVILLDDLVNVGIVDQPHPFHESKKFIEGDNLKMPRIKGAEFRTETNEWDAERQQYSVRFKFNSDTERKAHDEILKSQLEEYDLDEQIRKSRIKEERYEDVVDLYFLEKEMQLLIIKIDLILDKGRVVDYLMDEGIDIDLLGIYTLKEETAELSIDSLSVRQDIDGIRSKLNISEDAINWSDIVDVEEMIQRVSEFDVTSIQDIRYANSISKLRAEHNLEKAEAEKIFDFAQIQYRGRNNEIFQNEVSVGASINLPFVYKNALQQNEVILEILDLESKSKLDREELIEEVTNQKVDFLKKVRLYREFENTIDLTQIDKNIDDIEQNGLATVNDVLSIKLIKNKLLTRLLKMKKDIYDAYIEFLSSAQIIVRNIDSNHIKS